MELVNDVEKLYREGEIPLNSAEGFIRQLIGWREFCNQIYRNYETRLYNTNFFNHKRKMKESWYEGTTGIEPLDVAIKQAKKYGYCHHIERLMVLANFMNLAQIDPSEVYKWFMEMFVDSGDWVMAANVFGMGLMSEGGIFATKPYISGSNYIRKMSHYPKEEWCDVWDGLYWGFVGNNFEYIKGNPRMGMTIKNYERMDPVRRRKFSKLRSLFLDEHTIIEK